MPAALVTVMTTVRPPHPFQGGRFCSRIHASASARHGRSTSGESKLSSLLIDPEASIAPSGENDTGQTPPAFPSEEETRSTRKGKPLTGSTGDPGEAGG